MTIGNNHNTSGTVGPDGAPWTTCLNTGPGPGSDQIFGTLDDGTSTRSVLICCHFIPTSGTGTERITSDNKLDINNFHVKFDYVFNRETPRVSEISCLAIVCKANLRLRVYRTPSVRWRQMRTCGIRLRLTRPSWQASTTRGRLVRTKVLESRIGYQRFSQRIGVNNNLDPNALGINTGPLGADAKDRRTSEFLPFITSGISEPAAADTRWWAVFRDTRS